MIEAWVLPSSAMPYISWCKLSNYFNVSEQDRPLKYPNEIVNCKPVHEWHAACYFFPILYSPYDYHQIQISLLMYRTQRLHTNTVQTGNMKREMLNQNQSLTIKKTWYLKDTFEGWVRHSLDCKWKMHHFWTLILRYKASSENCVLLILDSEMPLRY